MFAEMAISAVNTALQTTRIQGNYQVAALKKSQNTQEMLGKAAIQLIQSATIDPGVGQQLNVLA